MGLLNGLLDNMLGRMAEGGVQQAEHGEMIEQALAMLSKRA